MKINENGVSQIQETISTRKVWRWNNKKNMIQISHDHQRIELLHVHNIISRNHLLIQVLSKFFIHPNYSFRGLNTPWSYPHSQFPSLLIRPCLCNCNCNWLRSGVLYKTSLRQKLLLTITIVHVNWKAKEQCLITLQREIYWLKQSLDWITNIAFSTLVSHLRSKCVSHHTNAKRCHLVSCSDCILLVLQQRIVCLWHFLPWNLNLTKNLKKRKAWGSESCF